MGYLSDTWPWQHTTIMDKCVAKHKPKVRISVEKKTVLLNYLYNFRPPDLPTLNYLRQAVSLHFNICVAPLTHRNDSVTDPVFVH